jgi:hypothetical protein
VTTQWPEELDALKAAPRHHLLLLENEAVRVLDTRIAPGEMVPLHTHRWPSVNYFLSWSDFVRCDADGRVTVDTRGMSGVFMGKAAWSGSLDLHTLENVGPTELHVISVELKDSRPREVAVR